MLHLHSPSETDTIAARFAESGALALLLVEIHPLTKIERSYGAAAYDNALGRLLALLSELSRNDLFSANRETEKETSIPFMTDVLDDAAKQILTS